MVWTVSRLPFPCGAFAGWLLCISFAVVLQSPFPVAAKRLRAYCKGIANFCREAAEFLQCYVVVNTTELLDLLTYPLTIFNIKPAEQ